MVLGYHGCGCDLAKNLVLRKEVLKPSTNKYDWLGEGIYFWENDPVRAVTFAKEKGIKRPAAVGAIIDLGNCLDMTTEEGKCKLIIAYRILKKSCEEAGVSLPENKKGKGTDEVMLRNLDCAVINVLHKFNKEHRKPAFTTVRGAFGEGSALYPRSSFGGKDHIQLCVRKHSNIHAYFLSPRKSGAKNVQP